MREPSKLSLPAKAWLAARVLSRFALVRVQVDRRPLPQLVAELGKPRRPARRHFRPRRLSRAVSRTLRFGPFRPRCLVGALVLYRMLREQGDRAEVVVGLPDGAADHAAHAWVELDGSDVGPFPGQNGHQPLARLA